MRLDVGCGATPEGDVNVDRYRVSVPEQCGMYYNGKKILNFIQADAHLLPFRSKCFDEVLMDNAIEHCLYPVEVLEELSRVAVRELTVIVPLKDFKTPSHLINWTEGQFMRLVQTTFPDKNVIREYIQNKHSGRLNLKVVITL